MGAELTTRLAAITIAPAGEVRVPIYELRAGTPGPGLMVMGVRHGIELSGAEAARRLLQRMRSRLRRGRLVVVPVANPLALHQRSYTYSRPADSPFAGTPDTNLHCCWPGRPDGDESERLVYAIRTAAQADELDCMVDIHCGEPAFASWVIERENAAPARELADVCAFRFIRQSPPVGTTPAGYFQDTGRRGITLELSGTCEIVAGEVRRGVRACMNIARFLGMVDGPLERDDPSIRIAATGLVAVTSPTAGLYRPTRLAPGDRVRAGQAVAHVLAEADWQPVALRAPVSGYLHTLGPNRPGAHGNLAARHAYVQCDEVLAEIAPWD